MIDGINQLPAPVNFYQKDMLLAAMAYLHNIQFIVDLPIKNGGSFHSYGTMIGLSRYIPMMVLDIMRTSWGYGILHNLLDPCWFPILCSGKLT